MAEDKPRLARLTAIITQLQAKRIVTAQELADKHEVSIRTIYRDIRTLEQSGIPIITEEGKGYSMMEGYKLPPVMFTEEEANALITAEHLLLRNKDQSLADYFQQAVSKVKAVLKLKQQTKTELISQRIQVRNNTSNEKTSNYLIQLQSTIANFQVVNIKYHSLNGKTTERKIEPFALYTTKDNWILVAYCQTRKDFRAFRLDCIEQIIITDTYFDPHNITLEQYLEECRKKWQDTPDIPLTQDDTSFASNQKN